MAEDGFWRAKYKTKDEAYNILDLKILHGRDCSTLEVK